MQLSDTLMTGRSSWCKWWGHIVLDGDPAPPQKRGHSSTPEFLAQGVVAKWLDGSWCHLVRRYASAQAHYVRWGHSSRQKDHSPPIFGPCLLWPNGRPSKLLVLLNTCTFADSKNVIRESIAISICRKYWYLFCSVLPTIFQYPFFAQYCYYYCNTFY